MKKRRYTYPDLLKVMARLHGPGGCPWDREQTHRSLLKYLREESAEVHRAVRRGDDDNLCEELGDLLLQVVFHAEMAKKRRAFTMTDIVDGLCKKLIRRHPHVFGRTKLRTAQAVIRQWKKLKHREKSKKK